MVFHFFERFVGNSGRPERFLADHRYPQLIEEGFSEAEAQQLTWLYSRSTHGKVAGFLGGVAVVYFMDPYYQSLKKVFPRLYYQPWIGGALKLGVIFLSLQLGDYIATSRRQGANMWLSNLYNNNHYIKSKEAFVRNFETLNRKFTPEEIEQFNLNRGKREQFERKWIYNPEIHGDEESFKKMVKHMQEKKPAYEVQEIKDKILEMNKAKADVGESLRLRPFDITEHVDKTGKKTGLDANPLFNHYKPLN